MALVTKSEAVNRLEGHREYLRREPNSVELRESLELAISALKKELNKELEHGCITNQEKFIRTFGFDAWKQMVAFSGLAEQFKEYWTSPYNESEDLNADN